VLVDQINESRAFLFFGLLSIGLVLEHLFPLRKVVQKKWGRLITNLSLGGVGAILTKWSVLPLVLYVSEIAFEREWGIIPALHLPRFAGFLISLLALDYALYLWHRMNHVFPFLWRFHNVHHVDLDLDISTASRFHLGELILSALFRMVQIVVLGIDPLVLVTFDTIITASAQFHHSNVRLPRDIEKRLRWLFVSPRMHGIHHSIVKNETDSNFSALLSIWDRLHGTLITDVSQADIQIGVPSFRNSDELGLFSLLSLPFKKPRPWRLPNGTIPRR